MNYPTSFHLRHVLCTFHCCIFTLTQMWSEPCSANTDTHHPTLLCEFAVCDPHWITKAVFTTKPRATAGFGSLPYRTFSVRWRNFLSARTISTITLTDPLPQPGEDYGASYDCFNFQQASNNVKWNISRPLTTPYPSFCNICCLTDTDMFCDSAIAPRSRWLEMV